MQQLYQLKYWFLVFFLLLKPLAAKGSAWSFDQMPSDLDKVDIYLHTVEVGNLIFNNFGHTALRVHDQVSHRDLVFNWGIFDFQDPFSFSFNFYRGILIYQLGIYPNHYAMQRYLEEERTVWEDKLSLNQDQKRRLLERLIWNSQAANRAYAYQYFFDNCSTRPRDYLDEALGGSFKKNYQEKLVSQTFRDMMDEGYSMNPGVDLFLDVVMNSRLDRFMTAWERMFHPLYLREALLEQQNEGHPLVESTQILVQFTKPGSYSGLSYVFVIIFIGIPLSLCGIAFFVRERWGKMQSLVYRSFALLSSPLLMLGGFLGFLMPLTWLVSQHLDLHHNAHILLFWPLDGILVIWVWGLLIKGRALRVNEGQAKFLRSYVLLHMIVTLFMPVLRVLGVIEQNIDRSLVSVMPCYMVILLLLWRVGLDQPKLQDEMRKA